MSRPASVSSACGLRGSYAAAAPACRGWRATDQTLERRIILAGLSSLSEQTRVDSAEDRPAASVDYCDDHLRGAGTVEDDSVARTPAVGDRHEFGMLPQGQVSGAYWPMLTAGCFRGHARRPPMSGFAR